MKVGALRNQVDILQAPADQDALGQPTQTWPTLASVWADVRFPSGLEAIKADAVASTRKASIRIRWRTDVTTAMRVVYGGDVYDIKAVLPDSGRRYVDLACELVP